MIVNSYTEHRLYVCHVRPRALLIIAEIRFPTIKGASATNKAMHSAKQQKQYIFLLMAGPTICSNILKGFSVKEILPTGGGKKGE